MLGFVLVFTEPALSWARDTEQAEDANPRTEPPGGLEQRVDEVAGLIVSKLGTVLFYKLFESIEVAKSASAVRSIADAREIGDKLTVRGVEVGEASLLLTVPQSVSEAEAEGLAAAMTTEFLRTPPRGGRSLRVVRSADASVSGSTLQASHGGMPIIVLWLAAGACFFTVRMGLINLRGFRHAIDVVRGRFDSPDDEGEVSHFQALASALSATVGLGNIAGVAIAVAVGGPGAIFWMVVAGFFGMSSKFVECTLGQKYREVDRDGRVLGGPMFYLERGLADLKMKRLGKVLAVMFAVLCIGGSLGGGNTFQVNQSLGILREQFPVMEDFGWVYGLVMTVAVGVVILGGIRRIASTAEKIVPVMCGVYVLAALVILGMNYTEIPSAFGKIFSGAFSPEAGFGGALGVMMTGIRRAAFSNEAGVGSAAIAHSAARTEYPVREGIVALLEPFIDTIVVCTMTGLVIVITGAYADPANAELIASSNGAALTSRAMGGQISWFPYILSVAVVMFAYSTMISWSYYGERCFVYLFGPRSSLAYKILFLIFVFLGSVITATNILEFGDLMVLTMGVPNILGLFLLSGVVRKELKEYMAMLKAKKFKVYE